MAVTAKLRHLRIAPRKVRLVADLIRGKSIEEAQTILNFTIKKAAAPLFKLLKSAVANAKNNFQLEESNLYISKITVDEGQKYKRWMPRARGQASEIQKKTSHITLVLDQIKPTEIKKIKKSEKEKRIPETEKSKSEKPPKKGKPSPGQAKLKPGIEIDRPKVEKGIKRIFRRKSF